MGNMRTLLYVFRGKLETESIIWHKMSNRVRQLQGCTNSRIFTIADDGSLLEYGPNYWVDAKNAPDEVKLVALLVN